MTKSGKEEVLLTSGILSSSGDDEVFDLLDLFGHWDDAGDEEGQRRRVPERRFFLADPKLETTGESLGEPERVALVKGMRLAQPSSIDLLAAATYGDVGMVKVILQMSNYVRTTQLPHPHKLLNSCAVSVVVPFLTVS